MRGRVVPLSADPLLKDLHGTGKPARLGSLAVRAGLTGGGFNGERWAYWLKRLRDLASGIGAEARAAAEGLRLVERIGT